MVDLPCIDSIALYRLFLHYIKVSEPFSTIQVECFSIISLKVSTNLFIIAPFSLQSIVIGILVRSLYLNVIVSREFVWLEILLPAGEEMDSSFVKSANSLARSLNVWFPSLLSLSIYSMLSLKYFSLCIV